MRRPARLRALLLPLASLLLSPAVGCGRTEDVAMPADVVRADGYEAAARVVPDAKGLGVAGGVAAEREAASPPMQVPAPTARDSTGAPMLIRTGFVVIRVDSVDAAMAAVQRLAASLGGVVGNVQVNAGEHEVRSATLELRIPAARFDAAMRGLGPIGRVENSAVNAQDVGEEYVDLRARVTNARRLETRLVDLLATRTGKLEDVLAVERELARVREEIERHEGRLRWLGARVATSTITVTVQERAPVVSTPGENVLVQAFIRAWRNFVGLVAGGIASLGVLLPLGVVLWALRRWWRRGRRAPDAG